ncbi:RodZ domain-containing protein [Lyngbya aestuarii]|uniref:RodZ domain-containing protein n=1 Tax=Lyngbya aestuarii TaxID=118322 RepID=UPI00403D62AB
MKENKLHVQQEQVEKLEELGSRLRQYRTQQSIPLEEVAAITRIQPRLLNAIEEGRLEQLPEPVYIQGFIRRFADALGLNGAEFASAFPTGSGISYIKPCWRNLPAAQLRPLHLYLLYVGLVIAAVSGLSLLVSRSAVQVVSIERDSWQTANLPEPNKPQQQLDSSQGTPGKAPSQNKPVQVGVTLKERSWIRVVADGKTEFEDILEEGTQRTWVADQQLTIRAGNAGGVMVEFNDEIAKKMGSQGEVEELTFAANPKS